MIPYVLAIQFQLGPITIYVWGLFVALGLAVGFWQLTHEARARGFAGEAMLDQGFWMIVAALIGARLFHVFFYEPAPTLAALLSLHSGFSSIGGIVGAVLLGLVFLRRLPDTARRLEAADAFLAAFPIGMAIGRVGCFLVHDHIGVLSNSFLAVQFPGGSRFDLGLLEALAMFLLSGALFVLRDRLRVHKGAVTVIVAFSYSVVRFFLDMLRARDGAFPDARFLGLTPAQYGMIVVFCVAIFLVRRFVWGAKQDAK